MTSPSFPNFAWKSSCLWPASLMSGFFVEDLLVFELPPVACGFHASSVLAPTSGLRVAGTSIKGVGGLGRSPLSEATFSSATAQPDFGNQYKSGCAVAEANVASLRGGPTYAADPPFGGSCDSQATGGSENARSVKLAGAWGECRWSKSSFALGGSRGAADPLGRVSWNLAGGGGSLQALIGGVPVPGRIQLFQRNGVAQMEWVPRRPLGRAFSTKIWEWRWTHEHNIAPKSPLGGLHGPHIAPKWANMAPT